MLKTMFIQDINKIRGRFTFYDSDQNYINYHPKGSFPEYAFEEILKGNFPPNAFRNKIIIVGTDTGKSAKEYVTTPFSREVNAMTSSEYHANVFQTLIDNNSPIRLPNIFNIILLFFIRFYLYRKFSLLFSIFYIHFSNINFQIQQSNH